MILLGAAGGDIAGSRFEFNNHRSKDFELFADRCFVTDDTVMTMAVAKAVMECRSMADLPEIAAKCMQQFGHDFPGYGYGGRFGAWLRQRDPKPYNSFGNGSAMRVSACGWAANSLDEAKELATIVSEPTHNHPEGIKGAVATAQAIWMARNGAVKEDIREQMKQYYTIDFTLDDIRDTYKFNETCQATVPQAMEAFFESDSYEDCLRCAISVGGDSDTLAAIAGSIAEAYFGIPKHIQTKIISYLRPHYQLINTLLRFNDWFELRVPQVAAS